MPRFRAPQQSRGRLQASFEKTAKRSGEQKNGRKCDLATALLPKGDTRATNARTEYHGRGDYASDFFCCVLCYSIRICAESAPRCYDARRRLPWIPQSSCSRFSTKRTKKRPGMDRTSSNPSRASRPSKLRGAPDRAGTTFGK